jgi:hypothetical protein
VQKVTETIVQFKVSEKASENAWGDLVRLLVSEIKNTKVPYTSNGIKEYLQPYEQEYMESYHSEDPEAIKKNGKWMYGKYLPNAYKSAKSVICRAANADIPISEDGNKARGKTVVEFDIQAAKSGTVIIVNVNAEITQHVDRLLVLANAGFKKEVLTQLSAAFPE